MIKTKKEVKWKGIAIGIIIYLIMAFSLKIFPFDNTNLKDCVDDCVQEHDYCVSSAEEISPSFTRYVLYYNYEDCFSDLEWCVYDCE
jgi:hypothetical protein